jgi:hypothetical protein
MFRSARHRARQKGIPFCLDIDDIRIPERCPLLDIPLLQKIVVGNGPSDNSPSLDRIEPSLGYVKGNIWVISRRANMIKNAASFEEFRLIFSNWKARRNVSQIVGEWVAG